MPSPVPRLLPLSLLLLLLLSRSASQSCGGQWGLCGLLSTPSSNSTLLVSLNPYTNTMAPVGSPVPYAFMSGGLPHSSSPLFFFIGSQQANGQSLVALNATDGSLSSAVQLPPFQPGLLHAYAAELGLVLLVGQLGGSSSTVVGTVQPGLQGSWVQHALLPDSQLRNPGLGGVASYVPQSQEIFFSLSQAAGSPIGSTLVACALASPGGACRTQLLPEGLALASLAYSPQDAQLLALCSNSSSALASLQAVSPVTLQLSLRGPLDANFSALFPASSSSSAALLLGSGLYSSMAWLGTAAGGGGQPRAAAAAAAGAPLYLLMSNLCSGAGGPPVNKSTGLPLPLCGAGLGPCPVALGALYAPPAPAPPPPALECSFAASYPQQMVVYKLAGGQSIEVDGRLEEGAWAEVAWSQDFVDATTSTAPGLVTRVKARWDDSFFYLGAWLQEPHVCANITSTCHCINKEEDQNIYDVSFGGRGGGGVLLYCCEPFR